jgi:hypothetical protein
MEPIRSDSFIFKCSMPVMRAGICNPAQVASSVGARSGQPWKSNSKMRGFTLRLVSCTPLSTKVVVTPNWSMIFAIIESPCVLILFSPVIFKSTSSAKAAIS